MTPPPGKKPTATDLSLARPGERQSDPVSLGASGVTKRLAADFPPSPISAPPHRRSRLAMVLASLLIALGLLVLADAGVTLVWQEPISALYAQLKQENLGGDLNALDSAPPTRAAKSRWRVCTRASTDRVLGWRASAPRKGGSAVGRIDIPTIGASFVVVKGTGSSELESGPGIYSETAFRACRERPRSPVTARHGWPPFVISTHCVPVSRSCSRCPMRASPIA